MSEEELRTAVIEVLKHYGIRGESLGSLRPQSVADALLPVVRAYVAAGSQDAGSLRGVITPAKVGVMTPMEGN